MSIDNKQNNKGFFAKLCEFSEWFEGLCCACNCLKTAQEH